MIREKTAHLIANLSANDTNMEELRDLNALPVLMELVQVQIEEFVY
tara:strand:+ start:1666 stop:1803 length:138 start_codon:yes stop_codon:yes gene_type:complete